MLGPSTGTTRQGRSSGGRSRATWAKRRRKARQGPSSATWQRPSNPIDVGRQAIASEEICSDVAEACAAGAEPCHKQSLGPGRPAVRIQHGQHPDLTSQSEFANTPGEIAAQPQRRPRGQADDRAGAVVQIFGDVIEKAGRPWQPPRGIADHTVSREASARARTGSSCNASALPRNRRHPFGAPSGPGVEHQQLMPIGPPDPEVLRCNRSLTLARSAVISICCTLHSSARRTASETPRITSSRPASRVPHIRTRPLLAMNNSPCWRPVKGLRRHGGWLSSAMRNSAGS